MNNVLKDVPRERAVAGYRRTVRGIRAGQIRCVLIARDADANLVEDMRFLCDANRVPYRMVSSKKEMGEELELDVPCAVCGVACEDADF